jgi:lysophospholipase L1-like esterase
MSPSSLRGIIARIAASAALVTISLELLIRFARVAPDNVPVRYRAMSGAEAFAPVPEQDARSLFGVHYRVNSFGLRGSERAYEKREGVTRVAVLGDSVVWGYGVGEEDTFVARLEDILARRGCGYEVWNLGVQATNLYNHRARYARLAPLVRPDLTIVLVLYNDLQERAEHFRITSVGTLSNPDRTAPFPDAWRPFLESTALYWAALRVVGRLEDREKQFRLENYLGLERQLEQIVAIARSLGSKIVLTTASGRYPPPELHEALAQRLSAFAAKSQVPFVDLARVLGNPGDPRLFLPADSTHPNRAGHEAIAEALAPYVE